MTLRRDLANLLLVLALFCVGNLSALAQQPAPAFSQIIVFGDSFSDTGNIRARTDSATGGQVLYPGSAFNYDDGRFTNGADTDPPSITYAGMWHEQLARIFLQVPVATHSLGGGTGYAFGGASTRDGSHDEVVVSPPFFGDVTITIDDMGRQMDDYLAAHTVDPNALYIVWGGINDLLDDDSAASVTATAARAAGLVSRLTNSGALHIMVPNVPPLGCVPVVSSDPGRITSLNAASANYRTELDAHLTSTLNALAPQGLAPTIYRLDVWTNTIRFFSNPGSFGFTDTRGSAQGNSSANPDQFLFWDGLHPTTAGHYWIAQGAVDALTSLFPPLARALNISTRAFVGTGERVPIAGFIVTGNVPKRVILRGLGPSLAASGVPNPLANPTLTLFDGAGIQLQTNDNWRDSQQDEIIATGIPPQNDLESAIVITVAPGQYTAVLAGQSGVTGNGLIEVYDLEPATNSTLANVSTRGFVGAGDNAMIAGLIMGNGDSPIVVLRAIGPTLASSGIVNPLLDPTIELHDGNGAVLGFNNNWKEGQVQSVQATQLAPTDDREAAVVAFLAPGNYTAVVRGTPDTTGVALVEAYRIP